MTETEKNELRVKVAELCPQIIRNLVLSGEAGRSPDRWQYSAHNLWRDCILNDPLVDLNACAEARQTLTPGERDMFIIHLAHIVHADYFAGICGSTITAWKFVDATAEQQCRAFVETFKELFNAIRDAVPPSAPSSAEQKEFGDETHRAVSDHVKVVLQNALREALPILEIVRDYEPGEPDGACAPNRARILCEQIEALLSEHFNVAGAPLISETPAPSTELEEIAREAVGFIRLVDGVYEDFDEGAAIKEVLTALTKASSLKPDSLKT